MKKKSATKSILKRGFKAKSEKLAINYREKLGIHPCEALCAFKLAEYLEINVHSATEFVKSPSDINLLSGTNGKDCEWSALTMITERGNRIIIHNPYNSVARQQSDVMHELAHIICDHKTTIKDSGHTIPFGMREFDKEQEEEAKCLGATLQLSRPGLLWAKKRNMKVEDIAAHFNASNEMVKYRIHISGVERQIFFSKK